MSAQDFIDAAAVMDEQDEAAARARAAASQLAEAAYIGHCHATRRKPIAWPKLEQRERSVWLTTVSRVAVAIAGLVAEDCAKLAHGGGQQDQYDEYGAGREAAADAIRSAFPKV